MNDHPVSQHFPLLDRAELARLADDIKQNGLREAIVVYEGMILDGRNRWRACKIAGVEPNFKDYCGDTPVRDVWSWNLHRRHLTPSQKAAIAVEILPELEAEAKRRQLATLKQNSDVEKLPQREGKSRDKAGALLNISGRYVFEAKTIRAKAPELFERIKSGTTTISEAKRQIKREEKRKALQDAARSINADREREISSVCDIRHCSCAQLFASGIEPDVVLTDPPYGVKYLDALTELAGAAKDVPVVAVMVGQSFLPEVIQRLCKDLTYRWTIAYLTPGGQLVQVWVFVAIIHIALRHIAKPMSGSAKDHDRLPERIYFGLPRSRQSWALAIIPWGQSVSGMSDLVKRLTEPGQLVCDPFVGGGATAVACLAQGCR